MDEQMQPDAIATPTWHITARPLRDTAKRFLRDCKAARHIDPIDTEEQIEAACQAGMTKEWLAARYGVGFSQMLDAYLSGNASVEELADIRRRYGLPWTSRGVLKQKLDAALNDLHAYYGDH